MALHTQFSDNPKLVDQMVCQLGTNQAGYGSAAILDCGTQGWYSMRREATQLGFLTGQAAVPTLGHPWHALRQLNHVQLMQLRRLLKKLPPPGKGQVVLVDSTGKVLFKTKN